MLFFAAVHNCIRSTPDACDASRAGDGAIDQCSGSTLAFPLRTLRSARCRQEGPRLGRYIFDRACHSSASVYSADGADAGAFGGGHMTALIVGLVSIAVVWLIVIYGSIYVNKNVQ
jgi:hypothetical protein